MQIVEIGYKLFEIINEQTKALVIGVTTPTHGLSSKIQKGSILHILTQKPPTSVFVKMSKYAQWSCK